MLKTKPMVWILDENIENQMVFSEMLDQQYDTYYFDEAEALRCFQANSKLAPHLLIISLACKQDCIEEFLKDVSYHAAIAIAPLGVHPMVVERDGRHFDDVFAYPYSKRAVLAAIEQSCDRLEIPMNLLALQPAVFSKMTVSQQL